MAKAESGSQGVFWGQVMRYHEGIAISFCLLVSSTCLAGAAKNFYHIPGGSTKNTAIAFVEKYDAHIHRGMSLNNLKQYWSDSKLEEFNAVAKEMTNVSGSSLFVDRRRLLDVEHANATCEKIELVDIKTTWKVNRKAKLEYLVTNICKDWIEPWIRDISLRYSRDDNRWSIQSIINSDITNEKTD